MRFQSPQVYVVVQPGLCRTWSETPKTYCGSNKNKEPICNSTNLFLFFQSNTSVLTLDLSDNWLGAEGGYSVCEMLKENCFITDLVCTVMVQNF